MNFLASRSQLRANFLRWALLLVPGIILLGSISGLLSNSGAENPWYASLNKPEISPPSVIFPIVWTTLYAMMGFAAAVIFAAAGARGRGIAFLAFAVQLALNLAWSPVFFGAHQIAAALVVILLLDVAVLVTIGLFWRIRWLAGALLLPYLAWILFATMLTWQYHELNPDADGRVVSGAVERIAL